MARRSDHTREELKIMAIAAGQKIIAQEGFSKFSARKVAKEMGYTIGTLYNIFEDYDDIVLHINAATLDDMYAYILGRIVKNTKCGDNDNAKNPNSTQNRTNAIKNLSTSYITFAHENYNIWNALFEFNFPQDIPFPDWYAEKIKKLSIVVETPILPLVEGYQEEAERTAKVLWAGVHGICQLGLTGKLDTTGTEIIQVLADALIEHYMRGLES